MRSRLWIVLLMIMGPVSTTVAAALAQESAANSTSESGSRPCGTLEAVGEDQKLQRDVGQRRLGLAVGHRPALHARPPDRRLSQAPPSPQEK